VFTLKSRRQELQKVLEDILGSKNVYYQPPESVKMSYPAIVYSRSDIWGNSADDTNYISTFAYTVTVIAKDPDNEVVDKVQLLPLCSFNRHYTSDNLNHDVFTLYY